MSMPKVSADDIEFLRQAMRREPVACIMARLKNDTWPVEICRRDGYFEVCGRGTRLEVYLAQTGDGLLVSVPNFNRCGHVPADCNAYDVADYVGIENRVDATTLAAAIRYIISAGLACSHPSVSMLPEKGGDK